MGRALEHAIKNGHIVTVQGIIAACPTISEDAIKLGIYSAADHCQYPLVQ